MAYKEFNWDTFTILCGFPKFITNEAIAEVMQVTVDTCQTRIQEKYPGLTFSDFRKTMVSPLKARILAKQFEMAFQRNNWNAVKWLGQNYCDQRSKVEVTGGQHEPIRLQYNLDREPEIKDVTPVEQLEHTDSN